MPAVSENQQQAAGAALAAKRGEMPASQLQGASKEMYDSMTEEQLRDFAKTETSDLPTKVEKKSAAGCPACGCSLENCAEECPTCPECGAGLASMEESEESESEESEEPEEKEVVVEIKKEASFQGIGRGIFSRMLRETPMRFKHRIG